MSSVNGVINVYKEKGFTSHDVVAKLRGILKTKKIGHTGTLDPNAEGVLPVCIGNATKLCDLIMEKKKIYEAELVLGIETDTEDMTGTVIRKYEGDILITEEEIFSAVKSFVGEYDQIPPMYSALKVNGKKLYELAREGVEIERKSRRVTIFDIQILCISLPVVKLRVECSKGTYIRALCRDIGAKLMVGGCMGELLRTASGKFNIEKAVKIEKIEELMSMGKVDDIIISTDKVLDNYPALMVKEEYLKFLSNGNAMTFEMFENSENISGENEKYRIYCDNAFRAVYQSQDGKLFKCEKMF